MILHDLYHLAKRFACTKIPGLKRRDIGVFRDPFWIWSGNPHFPEHDANGFRNKTVPAKTDVMVLGNSQAYCKTISREQSWPAALQEATSKSVYSCAVNGWSILQMSLAYQKFSHLNPAYLLVAVYPGFDICEAFEAVSHSWFTEARNARRALKSGGIQSADLSATNAARKRLHAVINTSGKSRADALRTIRAEGHVNTAEILVDGITYFLQEDWRSRVMDLENPAIEAGWQAFEMFFRDLRRATANASPASDVRVVVIPTKEYLCFLRRDDLKTEAGSKILEIGHKEERLRKKVFDLCHATNTQYIDLAPALAPDLKNLFHPDSENGHYAPAGACKIADIIAGALKERAL